MFTLVSVYSLVGNSTATLNSLTNKPVSGSSAISSLSTVNYPVAGSPQPNAANQLVFMNQPLSWWLAQLNSGAVKYTPISNEVNWSFKNSSGALIHIGIKVSDLIIPNQTMATATNNSLPVENNYSAATMTSTVTYVPKFGLSRVDTQSM